MYKIVCLCFCCERTADFLLICPSHFCSSFFSLSVYLFLTLILCSFLPYIYFLFFLLILFFLSSISLSFCSLLSLLSLFSHVSSVLLRCLAFPHSFLSSLFYFPLIPPVYFFPFLPPYILSSSSLSP